MGRTDALGDRVEIGKLYGATIRRMYSSYTIVIGRAVKINKRTISLKPLKVELLPSAYPDRWGIL